MPRRPRRHLRRMGDQQNLGGFGQPLQPFAHRIGHRTADAAIHFVEHHGGGRRGLGQRHFQGQRETRQLAARGDFRQRAERRAFHGGDFEGDFLQAVGRARVIRQGFQRDAEFRMPQFQAAPVRRPRRPPASSRRRRGPSTISGPPRDRPRVRAATTASAAFSEVPPPSSASCCVRKLRQHRRQAIRRGAVFAGQGAQLEQPLFLALQRGRVGVQARQQRIQLAARLLRLGESLLQRRFRGRRALARLFLQPRQFFQRRRQATLPRRARPTSASVAALRSSAMRAAFIIRARSPARLSSSPGCGSKPGQFLGGGAHIIGILLGFGGARLQLRQRIARRIPVRIQRRDLAARAFQPAEGIQQAAMGGDIEQAAIVGLAMHFQQAARPDP